MRPIWVVTGSSRMMPALRIRGERGKVVILIPQFYSHLLQFFKRFRLYCRVLHHRNARDGFIYTLSNTFTSCLLGRRPRRCNRCMALYTATGKGVSYTRCPPSFMSYHETNLWRTGCPSCKRGPLRFQQIEDSITIWQIMHTSYSINCVI